MKMFDKMTASKINTLLHFPFPGLNGLALAMGVHVVF